MRLNISVLPLLGLVILASGARAEERGATLTVESLLKDGWEIGGYAGTNDNRSSLILLKHKEHPWLVQCSVLFDVTRSPRTVTHCYAVR